MTTNNLQTAATTFLLAEAERYLARSLEGYRRAFVIDAEHGGECAATYDDAYDDLGRCTDASMLAAAAIAALETTNHEQRTMATKLTKDAIYVGCENPRYRGRGETVHVIGRMFGPTILAVDCLLSDAIDEYDERHGERVEADDPALADYPGDTLEARFESAMNSGEIRINDGGTTVWVDHYEWFRSFATVAEAGKFFREN